MATTTTVQKRKKKKGHSSSIDEIFEWSKQELYKAADFFAKRKSQIIVETAEKLDEAGVQKDTISTLISERLEGYVTAAWVREVLKDHPEYKNEDQSKRGKGDKKKSGATNCAESSQTEQSQQQEEETQEEDENNTDADAPTGIYQIKVEEYNINDVDLYDRTFLIELVRYLHNKLGQ